jgi:hypothetical protein
LCTRNITIAHQTDRSSAVEHQVMPSYSFVALTGLSILVASSGALPSPNGPFKGPPHGPHFPGHPTGISGAPIYPTGAWPTGFVPSGTATYGLPTPTDCAEEVELVKRFEGPRVGGPKKPWHHYDPHHAKPSGSRPPPFATGAPFPSGTQGWPTGGPPGPTAW